ncbi:MAG: hypothetical protein ONB44_07720 [candidate division KSB1 bacterium]|nr:hypothetical protein [candidate division KSB1 bacterium]MDZ7302015.1 hypothetical protein [candidate division KSB1 bacterium]MDZ7310197.1 hypothetical protein [candidate division KSB1 bacterium]
MSNAIPISPEVLSAATQLARKLGWSPNELLTTAISDFIRRYGEIDITAELDKIYSEIDSNVDPILSALQFRSLPKEEW